jgi:uncharacterized membrane protein
VASAAAVTLACLQVLKAPAGLESVRAAQWAVMLLAVGFVLSPDRASWFERCDAWLDRRRARAGAVVLGAAIGVFLTSKLAQHWAFNTGAYDLTMLHSAVHNTVHGKFLYAFGLERNFFAEHASLIMLAWVPFYWVAPHVETLLSLQAVATALAGWPLFVLARRTGLARLEAAILVAAFWVNPILWRGFVFDIHMELWAPLFVFATAASAASQQWRWFWCWALLALCVKEDVALTLGALALLMLAYQRASWKQAVLLLVVCAGWLVFATRVVIPLAAGDGSTQSHFIADRYNHLGSTPAQVIWRLLSEPSLLVEMFTGRPVRTLLGTVGPLALLDPVALVGVLPQLVLHRATNYGAQRDFAVYYGLPVVTILFVAAPGVIARWCKRFGRASALVIACLTALPATTEVSPPPITWPTTADFAANAALQRIPEGDTVSAQSCAIPHLRIDSRVSLFPARPDSEWLVLSLSRLPMPVTTKDIATALVEAIDQHGFHVVFRNPTLVLLRRGGEATAADADALHEAKAVLQASQQ